MEIKLRDYQADLIDRTYSAMRSNRRVLAQLPTGGGKTVVASSIVKRSIAKNKTVYFVVHRVELITQTAATFKKFGIPHSFIAAGFGYDPRINVQLVSIQTLATRLLKTPPPDLCIIDECHHATSQTYKNMLNLWDKTFFIGLTATPVRTDDVGLGDVFGDMVCGPSVAELMELGALSAYRLFVPNGGMSTAGVHKKMGDFVSKEIEANIDRPKLVGDAVLHWRKYASRMKTIMFAPSLEFSLYMCEQFKAVGVSAKHLDGNTPKNERAAIIKAYARGEIQILSNRFLFGEGFDLAAIAQTDVTIDAVIDLAPTASVSLAIQRWGRVLRPRDGKTAIILDHAGNVLRHGLPDQAREWTLDGQDKKSRSTSDDGMAPVICEGCFSAIVRPAPMLCPYCSHVLKKPQRAIEIADGELQEISQEERQQLKIQQKKEVQAARTIEQLLELARKRGYSPQWAYKMQAARSQKNGFL